MIKIEVTKSESRDELGLYPYKFDEIIVGPHYHCDLVLSDTGKNKDTVKLFVFENHLMLETTVVDQFIILNGKKMSGRLKLLPNDRFNLGSTELKVIGFEKNTNPDDFPYEKYEKILLNDGPQKDLVIAIENELKKLS